MKILVGDEFGVIKCVNTQKKLVESKYGEIKKENEVRSLKTLYDNNNDIVSVLFQNKLEVISWASKDMFYMSDLKGKNIVSQEIVASDLLSINILGDSNGNLNLISFDDEIKVKTEQIYENSIPKNLQKIKLYQDNQIYSVYKNSPFTIYDITTNKISFRARNLPNDELDLKVDIWDTDILNLSNSINSIYTSTAYGEIRFYDKKVKPRPIMNTKVSDKKINRLIKTKCDNCVVFGDSVGNIRILDTRKSNIINEIDLHCVRSIKGSNGSVRDLHLISKNIIASCGLDRYLNVFNHKNNIIDSHLYLKTKLTCLLPYETPEEEESSEEDDSKDDLEEDEGGEISDDLEDEDK